MRGRLSFSLLLWVWTRTGMCSRYSSSNYIQEWPKNPCIRGESTRSNADQSEFEVLMRVCELLKLRINWLFSYPIHFHACPKVGKFEVSVAVQQHVVWFDVSVNKTHGVDGVQSQHNLSSVKLCPLLWNVICTGEIDKIPSWHIFHYHVERTFILERTAQLRERWETIEERER